MFDTTKSCHGCPYRCSGRNEHCPYECNGCHGKCFGYECRVLEGEKRNQERRDSLAWISETERLRRLNVISSQKNKQKEEVSKLYAMRDSDRQMLDEYKALGTPAEIRARLANPFPSANTGYAPMPLADDDDFSLGGGLLEDEGPPIVDDPWADK